MDIKSTRSTTDLKQARIDSLLLSTKKEKQPLLTMANSEQVNINSIHTSIDLAENVKSHLAISTEQLGHEIDDQPEIEEDQKCQPLAQQQLNSVQKFNGRGNPKNWLKNILEKFDLLQLTSTERNEVIPDILTGDALLWYIEQQDHMPTFITFMKQFLQHFSNQELKTDLATENIPLYTPVKQTKNDKGQDTIMDCLRNQMLITNLEKVQKFSGKSKQNLSKWLQEIQQTMNMFKLKEDEKLSYVSLCLETDARDWFYDNPHLCLTWPTFVQNLLRTFESTGKSDTAFNRLRHYEQGINQDVRQYYFEIINLCKEANPFMDVVSKLQYLKNGLKPSLRFDVLLKDPKTPEEFLQYAQRIEELKLLDDIQNVPVCSMRQEFTNPISTNAQNTHIKTQSTNPTYSYQQSKDPQVLYKSNSNNYHSGQVSTEESMTQSQYYNNVPKPPYQCYKCGGRDHYIRNCPHFQ